MTFLCSRTQCFLAVLAVVLLVLLGFSSSAFAQGLNWEGQTGAGVTSFAYTSESPPNGFGGPQLSFHFLDTGDVIGRNIQSSVTVGFLQRGEFGYTRSSNISGSTSGLSPLFEGGFNTFHGKANLAPENVAQQNYLPAISLGFVARTQVRHVGGIIRAQDSNNGDAYVVATKTVTQIPKLPVLLNIGFKVTNASVFGIGGDASAWQGRWFGAAGIVLPGPSSSVVVLVSEFAQQPHFVADLPGATVPTTLTYIARIVPLPTRVPLNVDFAVIQGAGAIAPGVDLKARAQFYLGVSYRLSAPQ